MRGFFYARFSLTTLVPIRWGGIFRYPSAYPNEASNAAVLVANGSVNPSACEADLEPGGILFSNTQLGRLVSVQV
jgi:hypothetical protein